jgi:membrane peptidoglycan carboxypeptidase
VVRASGRRRVDGTLEAIGRLLWSTRLRRGVTMRLLAVAVLVGLGAVAWVASPAPVALESRVSARLGLGETTGRPVGTSVIAPTLEAAVIATEDERFYRHHGIDLVGVARALPYDIAHLSFGQGASTITEQVAKMLYLGGNDHSVWRKLEDAALAVKLERRYTKPQILDAYLNSVYFGNGAYGARAAAERYFGIPPRRLDLDQASLLAGLIQAPTAYDPFHHPRDARLRQAEVLRSLVRTGVLTTARAEAVLSRPLRLREGTPLRPAAGVDLSPGPVFVWWELALGVVVTLLGVAAFAAARLDRLHALRIAVALRLLLVAAMLIGAAAIVRSFRAA